MVRTPGVSAYGSRLTARPFAALANQTKSAARIMSRRYAPESPDYSPRWAAIISAAGPPTPLVYAPPKGRPRLLFQSQAMLAFDKPSGLLTVPGKPIGHDDCLETRVRQRWPEARIVHRLDRPTSGVVVMARTAEAHAALGRQFEQRKTEKLYIARVAGLLAEEQGVIDAPVCGDWPNRPRQMIDHQHGKPAVTRWRVLAREDDATRIALRPTTGRTHQLRLHMAWIGHPILGDEFYAPPDQRAAAARLQLHAAELALTHPESGEKLTIDAVCPF
ncbi:MAG: RluA family pseudouridine synthase [Neomegalonema sp.]|nr:RluA family pseudouridine synthase [Neomegalonema sp.]